jgi:hypothetical protein
MCLAGGIPRAVAIVSPVKDGSSTTRAPCTPESASEANGIFPPLPYPWTFLLPLPRVAAFGIELCLFSLPHTPTPHCLAPTRAPRPETRRRGQPFVKARIQFLCLYLSPFISVCRVLIPTNGGIGEGLNIRLDTNTGYQLIKATASFQPYYPLLFIPFKCSRSLN